ncbi:hypothetical protein ABIA31_003290 [Catenulispora sp. MAP5-51]|uniref:Ig-like domain-containing protein n=1 Tax=Catenulispora sp. MAP5-51 TaxID=3156298 RepID=UPI0035134D11
MQSWQKRGAWTTLAFTALTVVAFASPAEAQVSSTTTVSASPSTAPTGRSVALNAAVTCAGDPSGGLGMTFFDGGKLLATVPVAADGTSSLTTGFTTTGAHTMTAAYNGDGNCDASSGTTTVEVTPTPPPGPDIHNTYDIHNAYNNIHITRIHNIHIHSIRIHSIVKDGGRHRSWKSGSNRHRKSH